jgi:hypothetical protein
MSTVKSKNLQIGTDGTASNNFTIYVPGTPDGTLRVGNGNAGAATDVAKIDSDGFKFTSSIQIGTDATSSNNFTIYQPSTPDGTLRIGVGNADSPTEVGRFTSAGYKPATAPAFSAYSSAIRTISSGVWTKVIFDTERFDTNSNYDTSTYRFTPTVAGYYQVNFGLDVGTSASASQSVCSIYKNGSYYSSGVNLSGSVTFYGNSISSLVYCNGSTDYIEAYIYIGASTASYAAQGNFDAILIQQA